MQVDLISLCQSIINIQKQFGEILFMVGSNNNEEAIEEFKKLYSSDGVLEEFRKKLIDMNIIQDNYDKLWDSGYNAGIEYMREQMENLLKYTIHD